MTLIIIAASWAMFLSCSSDIILEPLPSLLGDYEGRYFVTENVGSTNQTTNEYLIKWRFSDLNYWMFDELNQGICTPSGSYTLTGEVDLSQEFDGQVVVCAEGDNPKGIFSLRQPGDSVIMTQIVDDVKKELRLEKVQ